MLLANIDDIIHSRSVESSRIEYKSDWNPEKVAHTICAFANDIDNIGGGYIILGISEKDGTPNLPPSGLDRSSIDRIDKELLGICNLIEPRYIPSTSQVMVDGKDIFVIEATVGPNRPYKCPDSISKDKSKRTGKSYYIRKLSSTIVADPNDERVLFEVSANVPFDCRANPRAKLLDIRPSLIIEYLSKINPEEAEDAISIPIESLCKNLKILAPPPNDTIPINAGILFFNEKPETFIEGARIEIVEMPDPTGEGMVETVFDGPLDVQLQNSIEYLRTNVIKTMVLKNSESPLADRIHSYPLTALEEIVSNAVYHKDYSVNEPVTIKVKPDRIEVTSIPGPDRSISDERIRNFDMACPRYRNARIGDLLKHRGLAEKRGTGIPTILRSLRMNGSLPPILETDPDRSYFKVTVLMNESFRKNYSMANMERGKRNGDELRRCILISLRDNGPMSVRELADTLGYSRNAQSLYAAIRSLVDSGDVEYTLPDKMSSRNQRIRLKI